MCTFINHSLIDIKDQVSANCNFVTDTFLMPAGIGSRIKHI